MAVSLSDIYTSFPELDLSEGSVANTAQDALVSAKLAEAKGMVDRSVFQSSTNADTCIKYLTARLVALSPAGMNMKLASKDGKTVYDETYDRLKRAAAFGFRVP